MKKITLSVFLLFFSGMLFSQSINVNTTSFTVAQLIQNVLIDSPCAQVSNFQTQGNCGVGYFSYGGPPSGFAFQDGVIIRCGNAGNSSGSFTDSGLSSVCSGTGDAELLAISQANGNAGSINDASSVKFNFTPFTDNFSFNFIFASNEYGTFQCGFSDVFAFILTDVTAGTAPQNLAVIPGTTTPVSVTNIRNNAHNGGCPSMNPTYFDVFSASVVPVSNTVMNMRGYTVPMTASATVIPNHNYTIKLVIGDYNDTAFDSAVFIEGGSFNVGVANLTYPIGLGGAYTQDMLVSNGQAICPGETRVLSTGLNDANFDFVWTLNGANLNIDAPSITVSQPGTYCVSASVTGGGTCSQTDCIIVEYFTGFDINENPGDLVVCSSPVDLTVYDNVILGTQDPAIHEVQYYYTMADAQAENNPITAPIAIALGQTIPIVAKVINIFAACPEYANFNVVRVSPNTVASASSTPSLCENILLTPDVTHATTGATGIGTPTGLPSGITATWSAGQIIISGTPTAAGVYNYSIPLTGGCGGGAATGTITVTPGDTVTPASSTPTLCVNTVLATINHTTTGATGIGTATDLPAGVTATWSGGTISIDGTPTATGTFNYTIPLTGGCGLNATGTITVNPNNTVTAASSTPTVCLNGSVSITHDTTGATGIGAPTNLPAGVTATWIGNQITISGTATATGVFNYDIPLTGGCGIFSATGTITVNSGNTVSTPSSTPTLCINTQILPVITHATTGATGIGAATNLPTGVTANFVGGNTIEISGVPTVAGIFNYDIPLTGGCGTFSATGTITVTPDNIVSTASATPELCVNILLTPFTHDTTGATGIGAPTNLPAGVTATWIGNQITISGTPTAVGVFNYSIPLTGGCGAINAVGTITVNPDNTVSAPSSTPTVCVNMPLSITHTTTGATGIGAAINLPAGVTATWSAGQITISGTPTVAGIFNYDIPLTGGCGTFSATGTITVNPNNTVTAPSSTPTLCVNTLMASIFHTTTGATGIGTATNLPTGVTASWNADMITISGTPTASGIFNYSIPLTGGCGGVATGTITVNSDNTVSSASATPILCINGSVSITHNTTGATGIGAATNLPAGVTATWNAGQITISGTATATGTFIYDIPLTGGCGAFSATGTITVNPDNTVSAPSSTPTLCVNTPLTSITHNTTGATGIGTATGLPAGVTATWNAGQIIISGTPTTAVGSPFSYSIPLTGGCGTFSATGTITVIPSNTVTAASATPTLCVDTPLAPIFHTTTGATGIGVATGLPAGVTASWVGNQIIISGTPTTAVGSPFNYTIPLTGGCSAVNATGTITVNPAPTGITISPVPNVTTCAGVGVNLTVTGTAGSVITWTGSSTPITIGTSGIASVTVFPVVDTVYTLISATLNGCTVPVLGQSTLVIVSATPQFINSNISDITICDGELLNLESQLGTTIAGATVVWSASASNIVNTFVTSGLDATNLDQTIDLENPLAVGTITIQVVPKIGNCFGKPQTIEVIITPRPDDLNSVISALPATPICDNESVSIKLVTPLATQYNWQMSATNNVNIVGGVTSGTSTTGIFGVQLALIDNLQPGNITFEVTPFNGSCSGATQTITITVNPIPKSPVSLPEYEVCSEEEANLVISLAPPFIDNTILEWQIIPSSNVTVDVVTASPSAPLLAGQSVTILDVLKNESDTQGFVIYRVTSKLGNCVGATVDYMVRVNPLPKPILTDGHICVNQATGVTYQGYVLDTQLSNPDYAYSWLLLNTTTNAYEVIPGTNDSTYETMEIGEYQVIVTNTVTNCVSKPVTADVNQIFPATAFSAVVTDAFTDNATITVTVNPAGTGNLIYSLDGGAWQASNVFTGVLAGPHEIMVEDVEGCTNLTQSIIVIDYPKYFTPNGDNIHDTWKIAGLEAKHNAKIYIFDRYGKLIKQISPTENSKGWDGTYNGQQAPSTDYWFNVEYTENEQPKQFKAHFSLKR